KNVLSGDAKLMQKDTLVVLSLLDSVQHYLNKDYRKTTYFSRTSYNIAKKLGYVEGEIMGLYGLGNSKIMEQDLDSASYFIDAGISLSKKVDSKRQLMNGWRYR